jgi:hypothetical protein
MAIEFNPATGDSGDYVTVPDHASLRLTSAFSLCTWFYMNNWTFGQREDMISKSDDYTLQVNGSNRYCQVSFRYAGFWRVIDDTSAPAYNTWYHLCGTYDNTLGSNQLKLYRDGALVAQASYSDTMATSTNPLMIGKLTPGSDATRSFHGRLCDCRVYNRALTAREALSIASARGTDGIFYGLLYRGLVMNERTLGQTANISVVDYGALKLNGTPSGTPIYLRDEMKKQQEES